MTAEASPRPWRLESDNLTLNPPVWFIVDANGAKITGGFFLDADAALIVDSVNRCERLRHVVRFLSECFTPEQKSVLRLVLAEARAAIGEGAK